MSKWLYSIAKLFFLSSSSLKLSGAGNPVPNAKSKITLAHLGDEVFLQRYLNTTDAGIDDNDNTFHCVTIQTQNLYNI